MKSMNKFYSKAFIIPAAIVYSVFFIIPTILAFVLSFTDWTSYSDEISFAGLYQFITLLTKSVFYTGLKNTLIFAVIVTVCQNVFALIIALIANKKLKTKRFIRMVFFMPCVLSFLIVGYAFSAILHPTGPLNQLLTSIGLGALATDWIMNPSINIYVIAAINVWMFTGFSMAIYLAGLQTIPNELYEAARIDGASWGQGVRHIALPLLAPAFTINIVMSLIGSMKVFELVFVTSRGGPGDASQVINTLVFQSFGQGVYAYATATSVVLFVIITIIALPVLKILRGREVES